MTANPPKERHVRFCEYIIVIIPEKFKGVLFFGNVECRSILMFKPGFFLWINRLTLVTAGDQIPLCCFQESHCRLSQKRVQSVFTEEFYSFPLCVILVKALIHRKVSSDTVIIYKVII